MVSMCKNGVVGPGTEDRTRREEEMNTTVKDLRRKAKKMMRNFLRAAAQKHSSTGAPANFDRGRPRLRIGEEGGALIEFAVVAPIMLLLMTCVFTFGITVIQYLNLTEATNTGARFLAVSRGQTTDPCSIAVNAIEQAAPGLAPSKLSFSFLLNGTAYSGTSCSSSSTTTGAAGNLVQGKNAEITVTYPCTLTVYNNQNFSPGGCTITTQTTEIVQ
jgi:Flp pilus assembly protein TadG